MKYIGAHISIAGGVENAPLNASELQAKAFGMFTKNQRQWQAKPFTNENIALFRFDGIPLILETPDSTIWTEEISLLYGMMR